MKRAVFRVPARLSENFRHLDADQLGELRQSLEANYFAHWKSTTDEGQDKREKQLDNHLRRRLHYDRTRIVPWLDHAKSLRGARIVDIGCGTGSSTVALAEQGALVTGVDIDESSIVVAKDRCRLHAVDADFIIANATDLPAHVDVPSIDVLIFFACLEHMTIEERLSALRTVWNNMKSGSLLVVIEAPNRLWFFDHHTSLLPFFHWLPDELAFRYSRYSPREGFREIYRDMNDDTMLHFLRRGRGMSFHEFDLTLGDARQLNVVSCLSTYDILGKWKLSSMRRRYMRLLSQACGGQLHEGFLFPNLNMIFRKA